MSDTPQTKQCTKCGELKPLEMFFKSKLGKYGRRGDCKTCHNAFARDRKNGAPLAVDQIPDGTKRCGRCGEVKSFDAFALDRSRKSGLTTSCKACQRIYREANVEHIREYLKEYRATNAEKIKRRKHADYLANIEVEREKRRAWRQANPDYMRVYRQVNAEAIRAYSRVYKAAYYKANRTALLENMCLYREINRDELLRQKHADYRANAHKRKMQVRAWRQAHPEKARVYAYNRRARIKGNGGRGVTVQDIAVMRVDQQGRCAYCKRDLSVADETLDHIIPLRYGGMHDPDNTCLCCAVCNASKHARTPEEWTDRWYLREDAK